MKKGITKVNWVKICSPLENEELNIYNLQYENNAYLLKLTWNFAYTNKPWSLLLKARVLKSTNLYWLMDPLILGLRLNCFMSLFLNIPLGLLVHVLLLIFGMINGVLLLVYQTLQGYLMVLDPDDYNFRFLEWLWLDYSLDFTTSESFFLTYHD